MQTFNIYSNTLYNIDYQRIDKIQLLIKDQPVFCIVPTGSLSTEEIVAFHERLSEQEKERAARFKFLIDRNSYIITHGRLRQILGQLLECEPSKIGFVYNNYGKPSISDQYPKIHFSLSHSSGLSIIGFDTNSEIGVDIEKIDPQFEYDPIVQAHFTRKEQDFIFENRQESKIRFYTLWTRKEAFLKAIGTGIGEGLGVEVLNGFHRYEPGNPIQGIQCNDFHLDSFVLQMNYLITTANNYPKTFIGLVDI